VACLISSVGDSVFGVAGFDFARAKLDFAEAARGGGFPAELGGVKPDESTGESRSSGDSGSAFGFWNFEGRDVVRSLWAKSIQNALVKL
jgi:hypothetical protein